MAKFTPHVVPFDFVHLESVPFSALSVDFSLSTGSIFILSSLSAARCFRLQSATSTRVPSGCVLFFLDIQLSAAKLDVLVGNLLESNFFCEPAKF